MKPLLVICFGLMTVLPGFAQNIHEYGKPDELKNLKKVFIDTGSDVSERNKIADSIEKAKLTGLEILDSVDEAEIVLQFSGSKEQRVTGSPSGVLFDQNNVRAGSGVVFIRGKDPKKFRLILSVEAVRDKIWKNSPSTKFTKEFISAYKRANGLK